MNRQHLGTTTTTALSVVVAASFIACNSHETPLEQVDAGTSIVTATEAPPSMPTQTATAAGNPAPGTTARSTTTARMPRGYRQRMLKAVKLNNDCVTCHQQQANEWRGSHHQMANLNPAYRHAFDIEPTGFCRGCHAPEAIFNETPPAEVSALGVGCVTCHVVTKGVVLAATRHGSAGSSQTAPHPLQRTEEFGQTAGCGGCHEFHFPGRRGDAAEDFMQTTVREHRSSPAADKSCASCHMPVVKGRRSHAFARVRDNGWLRDNLSADVTRSKDTLNVTLEQPRPGHAFPTGDLFRRVEVGCEWLRANGSVIAKEVQHLARHFEVVPGRPQRQLVRDDRIMFEPKFVSFKQPAIGGKATHVRWWVSYQRVATVGAGTDPTNASVESEVQLHSGSFPWDDTSAESRNVQ